MSPFDVYHNLNPKTRNAYPYLVDVQNAVIGDLSTCLVIPLTLLRSKQNMLMRKLTPEISINGEDYLLLTQQLTSMPAEKLKTRVGGLKGSRAVLLDAIDFATTGI